MDLLREFLDQCKAVSTVWAPFLLCLAIGLIVIWRLMEWRYRAIIDKLERGHVAIEKPAPPVAKTGLRALTLNNKPDDGAGAKQLALIRMRAAITAGRFAMGEGTAAIVQNLPQMKAALLTAQKEFGIPKPSETASAKNDLRRGIELLEAIVPLIAAGHEEEAKAEAEKHAS